MVGNLSVVMFVFFRTGGIWTISIKRFLIHRFLVRWPVFKNISFFAQQRERERGNSQVIFVHTGLVRQQIWVFFGFDKDLGDDQGRVLTVLVLHLALAVLLLALAFEWHDRCQMLGSMNLDCLSCVICIHLWSPYCLEKISQRHPYI